MSNTDRETLRRAYEQARPFMEALTARLPATQTDLVGLGLLARYAPVETRGDAAEWRGNVERCITEMVQVVSIYHHATRAILGPSVDEHDRGDMQPLLGAQLRQMLNDAEREDEERQLE